MSMEIKGNLPDYGVRKQNYSNYTANYVDTAKKPDNKAAAEVKTNTSANSKDKVQAYQGIKFNIDSHVAAGGSGRR